MPDALVVPPPPWTLEDYARLVETLRSRGLKVIKIDEYHAGVDGVWLRHDVEIDLQAAVNMARLEADLGICAHYFLCPESPMILRDPDVFRMVADDIRALGHAVSLHLMLAPRVTVDQRYATYARFVAEVPPEDVSIHAPGLPPTALVSVQQAERVYQQIVDGCQYYSDSTGRWRWGDPVAHLFGNRPNVQILTHPYWWSRKESATYVEHSVRNPVFEAFMPQLYSAIVNG